MNVDNKKYYKALIIALISILLVVELPYSDKSIIQYIIPVIRFRSNGSVTGALYLSGLIPLVGLIWSYMEIIKSNRFKTGKIYRYN